MLGLLSLVVLLAHALHPEDLPTRRGAWYSKASPPSSMRLRVCVATCGFAGIDQLPSTPVFRPILRHSCWALSRKQPPMPPDRAKVESTLLRAAAK